MNEVHADRWRARIVGDAWSVVRGADVRAEMSELEWDDQTRAAVAAAI